MKRLVIIEDTGGDFVLYEVERETKTKYYGTVLAGEYYKSYALRERVVLEDAMLADWEALEALRRKYQYHCDNVDKWYEKHKKELLSGGSDG